MSDTCPDCNAPLVIETEAGAFRFNGHTPEFCRLEMRERVRILEASLRSANERIACLQYQLARELHRRTDRFEAGAEIERGALLAIDSRGLAVPAGVRADVYINEDAIAKDKEGRPLPVEIYDKPRGEEH